MSATTTANTTATPDNFRRRRIDLAFRLGTGSFGATGADTVTLTGLRCQADIVEQGNNAFGALNLRVFGVSRATMNKLTILNKLLPQGRRNSVAVSAGSDLSPPALVFTGDIYQCWIDAQSAPDVSLTVAANVGLVEALVPAAPSSYSVSSDVATILKGLATQMNMGFQNNGVSVILPQSYFPGTALQQARAAAEHANINMDIGPGVLDTRTDSVAQTVMTIWPKTGTRGGLTPLISATTGMIGYPTVTQNGLMVRTVFNPGISFGSAIEVKSEIDAANGIWPVFGVIHNLESETPGGAWFTELNCGLLGFTALPVSG